MDSSKKDLWKKKQQFCTFAGEEMKTVQLFLFTET